MERSARASSAKEVRASEAATAAMAASSAAWSPVTSLMASTRDPNSSTCARCPAPRPRTTERAMALACASRPAVRMLNELSMASTVTAPERSRGDSRRAM